MWYHNEPNFGQDISNSPIWRYMDLGKYLELLRSETLWFPAASRLGDPWEGALFGDPKTIIGIDPADAPEAKKGYQHRRRVTCVSCWHSSQSESAAMWNHYGHQGVAIVSDPMSLVYGEALPDLNDLHHAAGTVRYIDHAKIGEWPKNHFAPFFAKRLGFESEREFRIAISDETAFEDAKQSGGIALRVNISELISEVRVSPDAPPYLLEVVNKATRSMGWEVPIEQSEMAAPAHW